MDRLHEIEVFIAVADTGSFTRAGSRLRLSPPAVTRAVAALENRLGARVFNRTTRSLTITDIGQRFLERARRVLADLDAAEKEAVGEAAAPQGHLTVTASVTFGRRALMPVVSDFIAQHPRITASVMLLDRVANLIEEGIDVAVRIGHLPDSTLIAKRIGEVHRVLVASSEYLAGREAPSTPAELRQHPVIAFTGLMRSREWRFASGPKLGSVALDPVCEVNDAAAAIQSAEMGHGITMALSYMVSDQIRDGRLVTLLDDFALPPQPVHLVYPEARLVAPKVRAFIDFSAPKLANVLDRLTWRTTEDRTWIGHSGDPGREP